MEARCFSSRGSGIGACSYEYLGERYAPPARQEKEPRRTLRTVAAARYVGVSASLLRNYRAMGRDDPGVHGPAHIKVSANIVLYEISALDDWLDARRLATAG